MHQRILEYLHPTFSTSVSEIYSQAEQQTLINLSAPPLAGPGFMNFGYSSNLKEENTELILETCPPEFLPVISFGSIPIIACIEYVMEGEFIQFSLLFAIGLFVAIRFIGKATHNSALVEFQIKLSEAKN